MPVFVSDYGEFAIFVGTFAVWGADHPPGHQSHTEKSRTRTAMTFTTVKKASRLSTSFIAAGVVGSHDLRFNPELSFQTVLERKRKE